MFADSQAFILDFEVTSFVIFVAGALQKKAGTE